MQDIPKDSLASVEPEFECAICNDILFQPVSINCGHTFCKNCLITTLRNKPQCPLCRTPCFIQERSLKENITLKSIIGNKYSEHIKRRDGVHLHQEEIKTEENPSSRHKEGELNPMIILPLYEENKILFPNSDATIAIRLPYDPKIISNICNDKKFLAVEESVIQNDIPHITSILEFKDLRHGTKKDQYFADVRVLNRITLQRISDLELDPEVLAGWDISGDTKINIKVGYSHYLKDKLIGTVDQVREMVEIIEEILNRILNESVNSSQSTAQYLMIHLTPLLQLGQRERNLEYYVQFSLALANLIRCQSSEKKRMFETTNPLERLLVLKAILDRPENQEVYNLFSIEAPGLKHFSSLKASLVALVVIVLVILFIKFFMPNAHRGDYTLKLHI